MQQLNECTSKDNYPLDLLESLLNQENDLLKKQETLLSNKKESIENLMQVVNKLKSSDNHNEAKDIVKNKRKSEWIVQLAQSFKEQIIETKCPKLQTFPNEPDINNDEALNEIETTPVVGLGEKRPKKSKNLKIIFT